MCKIRKPRQCSQQHAEGALAGKQAFFSLDAAVALVMVVAVFSSFHLLFSSAASKAASQAEEASSSLLAVRLSSYFLEKAAVSSDSFAAGAYYSANELDEGKLRALDLEEALLQTGRKFASVSVKGEAGEIFFSQAGKQGNQTYCAGRLAKLSGETVRLEACLS